MTESSNRYKKFLTIIAITLLQKSSFVGAQEIINKYIQIGLDNNLILKQKELNLQKCLYALKEANGLFYPSVNVDAQYMLADGGRSIQLPVGDMLNPVYSSLNEILQNSGQTGSFPQIANEEISFLPDNYHDTKLRIITPLINHEIYYNRKIKKEMINTAEAEVNVFKRELIKDIKCAYYRYLQSEKVAEAYQSALNLVNEVLRVNRKLVENQMAGPEKTLRIQAEQSQIKAQLTKAVNEKNTAAAYFNFLINLPLSNEIITDSLSIYPVNVDLKASAFQREELDQVKSAVKTAGLAMKMNKSVIFPTVTNITDIGYQGYKYLFDDQQQYYMNTISLSWPLFSGFQNRRKYQQSLISYQSLQKELSLVDQQLELQSRVALSNLESSEQAEDANRSSLRSSAEYYKVISSQYATGQKSLLDLIDARNQLTNAEISYQISHFEVLMRLAELERSNASANLASFNN